MQTQVNDQLMNSMIGRSPAVAAPTPSPEKAASLIGVSNTRRGPNLSSIPSDTLYAPLYSATSSPMRNTFSSRSISSVMAARRASRNCITGMFAHYSTEACHPEPYSAKDLALNSDQDPSRNTAQDD